MVILSIFITLACFELGNSVENEIRSYGGSVRVLLQVTLKCIFTIKMLDISLSKPGLLNEVVLTA